MPTLPAFSHQPKPYTGPSAAEVLAMRKQYLNPALFTYYKKPIMIVEAKRQYLFDETGRRYLDGFAGIVTVSVGHCHPNITEYGRALAAKMPGNLKVCYFVNSGSEANSF